MKMGKLLAGFLLGLLVAAPTALMAESVVPADTKKDAAVEKKDTASTQTSTGNVGGFSYRPPMRGAPAARIGGGTRGVGDKTLELVVLAPDHTGLTTKEQPTLYWYVSEAVPARLEVTLINDENIDPELEQIVATPGHAGIQSIDLSKTETRLVPDREYRWFVSVIGDPSQRSNDIVASGTIQRIAPTSALKSEIAATDERKLAGIYAKEGVWYDAIDTLSRMIGKFPDDSELQQQRTLLLEQVGLQTAASYTRTH